MTDPIRLKPMFDLGGRTALVTGASNILGPEFSSALAEFGARVAMLDVDGPAAAAAADRIGQEFGAEVEAHVADVTDEAAVAAVVGRVAERWGGIDILVNAAATKTPGYFRPLLDYERADWDRVLEVNLTGMFVVTRQVLRGMVERGRGSIINIASQYGVVGPRPVALRGVVLSGSGHQHARRLFGQQGRSHRLHAPPRDHPGRAGRPRELDHTRRRVQRPERHVRAALRRALPDGPHGPPRGTAGRGPLPGLGRVLLRDGA